MHVSFALSESYSLNTELNHIWGIYANIYPLISHFSVFGEKQVFLDAGKDHEGVLLCSVSNGLWSSIELILDQQPIGMFYENSTIQYPALIDNFEPLFNVEPNGEVKVEIKASLKNINTSLCSTDKVFTCNINVPSTVISVGGLLIITGK